MPIITFFNPKGGSGKTTASIIINTELRASGATVAGIDGDPNTNLYRWSERRGIPTIDTHNFPTEGVDDALAVIDKLDAKQHLTIRNHSIADLPNWIDAADARYQFTVIDPEGTANQWVSNAVTMSDLVVIPLRPAPMDADQMVSAVKLIESQSRAIRREIKYRILFTCTDTIMSRDEREIREHIEKKNYPVFRNSLVERAAYRAIIKRGETLAELPQKGLGAISNVPQARDNAAKIMIELIQALEAVKEVA